MQERAGEQAIARRHAPMIRDRLAGGARAFVENQGVVAVAAATPDGALWASLWCGDAGFARTDASGQTVQMRVPEDRTLADDPVLPILRAGEPLAMLVIDFARRGRLRINGLIRRADATELELGVRETFGNCVKYIQRRQRVVMQGDAEAAPVEQGTALDTDRRKLVARTDTLFVASVHRERGLDVSHRGGRPGFVRMVDDRTLSIPDYQGNSLFQTLGNFEQDPRAGLALIDFERCRVLSLTGTATIQFGAEDLAHPTGGTGRYWSFVVDRWVEHPLPSTMRWQLIERSPFNP